MTSRTSGRSTKYQSDSSSPGAKYSVSSPGGLSTSQHDSSFNSSLYRSSSDVDSDSDNTGGRSSQDSLNLTHEINVEEDVSPARVSRSELRKRETIAIHNRSGGGSPRPKRRSPRNAGTPASPTGSTKEGSVYGSPLGSPSLEEALRKGRGATRKHGAGSVSPRRALHSQKMRQENDNADNIKNICFIGLAVVVVGCFLFIFNPFRKAAPVLRSEAPSQPRKEIILENLAREFLDLRNKFPQQDRRFWSVIAAATKRVVQDDYPTQPAVLMLVSPAGARPDITDCLATHITDAVRRAHNNSKALKVNLHQLATTGKAPDVLKLELDDMLSNSFGSGDKAGLLYNIQDLPSRAAMLFHSYCDNENAPFKDITLTFTVKMDNSAESSTGDEVIEEFFYTLWSDLDKDTLSPLLSRVANSIAVVRQEDTQVTEQHCNS